jgi:hypothetical protein
VEQARLVIGQEHAGREICRGHERKIPPSPT